MSPRLQTPTKTTSLGHILSLLDDLPSESLPLVEQFVRFLHEQAEQGQPVSIASTPENGAPYHYPTIAVPPSSLDGWLNQVLAGYEGDALADTEALYDEA